VIQKNDSFNAVYPVHALTEGGCTLMRGVQLLQCLCAITLNIFSAAVNYIAISLGGGPGASFILMDMGHIH